MLHVEQPDAHGVPPTINGTSIGYITWNMNKRLFLDLKAERDRESPTSSSKQRIKSFCATCGWASPAPRHGPPRPPGSTVARHRLRADRPPAAYRLHDNVIQVMTGFWVTRVGEAYRHYTQLARHAGEHPAQAILLGRTPAGAGQMIDVTMFDAAATLHNRFAGFTHEPAARLSLLRPTAARDGRWMGRGVTVMRGSGPPVRGRRTSRP